MNSKEKLMSWFEDSGYDITITRSNSRLDLVGMLIDHNRHESFTATGRDEYLVLSQLKNMVEGNYKNSRA